tara:strand:+ start:166607 stop:167020 length:414 start_codon:yes stop_codon:yes gene_type:complete
MSLLQDLNILLVEDSDAMRKLVKILLKDLGVVHITEANSVDDAMGALASNKSIQVILCDINMPEKSGLELLDFVHKSADYKDLVFVMVTGDIDSDSVVDVMKRGAFSYVTKPIQAKNFAKLITEVSEELSKRNSKAG